MKNGTFRARFGYALAGIRIVWRREKSFRTQCALAVAAIGVTLAVRPGPIWWAVLLLAIALVLALEAANAALEYLIDRVHPQIAEEIKFAKDASAGAVLIGSLAAAAIGGLMLVSQLPARISQLLAEPELQQPSRCPDCDDAGGPQGYEPDEAPAERGLFRLQW